MNNLLMLLGLLAGLVLGLAASLTSAPPLQATAAAVEPLGDVFIAALQMVVIPLVVSIVFAGVARLGDTRTLGRMGGAAVLFIFGTTLLGVLTGMGVMALTLQFLAPVASPAAAVQESVELPGLVDFLVSLIPANPFDAASQGRLLPLLVFSVLFGAAAGTLDEAPRTRLVEVADAVADAFIKLIHWILWVAPLGIFGLAAPAAARMGMGLIQSLLGLIGAVVVGLFLFMTVVYLPAVAILGKVRPWAFIRGTLASYTMGFSTTSSAATLPVLIRDAPLLGVSERVSDLVLPLAAAMNRSGSGLFQGASVVFLAWLFQIDVPGGAWAGAVVACFFAAATVAPVPSASIMTLAPALDAVGVPLSGLGILLGVDRIPDMFRSGTNVSGHMAAAVVVQGVAEGGPETSGAGPDSAAAGASARS